MSDRYKLIEHSKLILDEVSRKDPYAKDGYLLMEDMATGEYIKDDNHFYSIYDLVDLLNKQDKQLKYDDLQIQFDMDGQVFPVFESKIKESLTHLCKGEAETFEFNLKDYEGYELRDGYNILVTIARPDKDGVTKFNLNTNPFMKHAYDRLLNFINYKMETLKEDSVEYEAWQDIKTLVEIYR